MSSFMQAVIREEIPREHTTYDITEFNHMFETTLLQSRDNQEEEEYDWSEKCDVAEELENKDKEISNLSETIAKQDETIAQLNSEIKRLMPEKKIEKDVESSYVKCQSM
ncbi:hypothetical protein QVD17_24612 [Tagetes erecta]|uniref:Uncharacterized protein n=1 Tax=Tagetes erecta TaxID=13708 RepID=A0AAD8KFB8_TARER|nr:hypothetical protein QVD17_24612 [Tagetes erecta]